MREFTKYVEIVSGLRAKALGAYPLEVANSLSTQRWPKNAPRQNDPIIFWKKQCPKRVQRTTIFSNKILGHFALGHFWATSGYLENLRGPAEPGPPPPLSPPAMPGPRNTHRGTAGGRAARTPGGLAEAPGGEIPGGTRRYPYIYYYLQTGLSRFHPSKVE